jgi:flagellar motility protein MotE (MotC chaperone)
VGLKKILILAGIGTVCFLVSLMLGWKAFAPAVAAASEESKTESPATGHINPMTEGLSAESKTVLESLSEKQLESLIFELREKIKESKKKEQELAAQEERLKAAGEEIKGDLEKLAALRAELATTVSQIKQERESLGKDRLVITAAETVKLTQIAAIHDKMDAASGAAMLVNMAANGRIDDAVQILNFMQERNAAKVLGEMVGKDPKVAALLCEKLKKIKQEGGK